MKYLLPLLTLTLMLTGCSSEENNSGSEKKNKVLLKLSPEKGKEYLMLYTLNVHNDTTGDETTFTIELLNKVESVKESVITISSLYQNVSMIGNLKGKNVNLKAGDTTKSIPEASLMAAPVFAFHNYTVTFEYNNQFRKVGEKIENADTIKALTNVQSKAQFIAQYPEKEIGLNETWKSDIEMKFGDQKIKDANFTVKSISESEVIVEVEAEIMGKGDKFGYEFTMTGTLTGEVTIDRKTGWQNKAKVDIEFVLDMMGNKTPMRQEISYNLR